MKKFDIPAYYRSSITGKIKESRRLKDLRKQDFSPTVLDFGPVQFFLARHFGFCYGVENAIEISYKALEENPGKRVYLLSQMIHNQEVNADLQSRGIQFIMDTDGKQFIPWEALNADDIVIVPAFGTTIEMESLLLDKGIEVQKYNTTCPFVEKVWNRSEKLGDEKYSVIIHGKPKHEETRATFSHASAAAPSIIVRDMEDAKIIGKFIEGSSSAPELLSAFEGKVSNGFDPSVHLNRVGVVNQTTMLATETQGIADYFRQLMITKFGVDKIKDHFADTRDTLCYATNDNQDATYQLLHTDADLAIVVGGYNSSNTSHIVELCERKFKTYFINSEREIISKDEIQHFNYHRKEKILTTNFLPEKPVTKIVLTSGASCPDTLVDRVMLKLLAFFENSKSLQEVLKEFEKGA
ncbi:4-hydroxy-3-methylbut-2-enyl diphosphate reductase [Pseudochryseolinea flava]|uniref:4-hydroxy-3-methylbut-2-enyl diphosphate reductase n=1 Tax=Pseudochryseolinea flava TaxID=2059302 RepID=A0A364Y819_9BACT|nr:4-hydroxy-3-methylbut-2-enyl diphosphate reductase [Pseudochryseolinea flava]RAW03256.1 4-hydroxy-3-methylbut-2-enyl diphosphate reductase [Pseudochryseolinea flava]